MSLLAGSYPLLIAGLLYIHAVSGQQAAGVWDTACQYGGLEVTSPDGPSVSDDNCDELFKKEQWQKQPKIIYPDAKEGERYTVVCVDPDAPRLKQGTYYLHMILANVEGSALANGDLSQADVISSYVGPAPPENTGDHRYQFLVYKHAQPDSKVEGAVPQEARYGFDLPKWLNSINVSLAGPEADYVGPSPPKNTGIHRYQYVVYKHTRHNSKITSAVSDKNRYGFDLAKWISSSRVELSGPVAGVQFKTQFSQNEL